MITLGSLSVESLPPALILYSSEPAGSTLFSAKSASYRVELAEVFPFMEPIMDLPSVLPHSSSHTQKYSRAEMRWVKTVRRGCVSNGWDSCSICSTWISMTTSEQESIWRRITVNWRPHARQRGTPWDRESSVRTEIRPRRRITAGSTALTHTPFKHLTHQCHLLAAE